MPAAAEFDIRDGSTANGPVATIVPLRLETPSAGAQATVTAIVLPQQAGEYAGRTIVVTVGGVE